MPWNDGLTGRALQIASTTNTPLRVMAGPGTGKSYAMKRRVARWLEEGVAPERILAVTFTRTAGDALKEDLEALGVAGCERVRAGTLHSFCFRLLGIDAVFAMTGRAPRPLMTLRPKSGVIQFEGSPMAHDLIRADSVFGPARELTKRVLAFEAAWARLQHDDPGWPTDPIDQSFQRHLISWLRFHNAILIGELVPLALSYLQGNPTCDALSAYDHIVVDEYQDLNKAEQALIGLLARAASTSIVGDHDQSIYSFRHAHPEGIVEFAAVEDAPLDECRRCPRRVVVLADELIRQNYPPGNPRRLTERTGNPDGQIHVVQWTTIEEQTVGLSSFIGHLTTPPQSYSPGDILVLSPSRLIGYALRDEVRARGIAVHSYYYEEALESGAAKQAFCLLRLLVDPEDRVALRYWLGIGSDNSNAVEYERLRNHCGSHGVSPRQALEDAVAGRLTLARTTSIQNRFRELQNEMAAHSRLSVREAFDRLLPDGEAELALLREAGSGLDFDSEETTLSTLHNALEKQVTQPDVPEDADFVRVMSLHKSKGLTSKVVIVAGVVDGLIPRPNKDDRTHSERLRTLQEQRRLFYVAITRCTDLLVLSSMAQVPSALSFKLNVRGPRLNRTTIRTRTSDFITEMGPKAPGVLSGTAWKNGGYL